MAKQVVQLELVLLKLQSVFGTMETSLTTTDFVAFEKPKIVMDIPTTEIALTGGGFSNRVIVPGTFKSTFTGSCPMRTGGAADTVADWTLVLQACGWKLSGPTSHKYTYTPSDKKSEWKDATVWGYSGNLDSNAAFLSKAGNVMFNNKISVDFDKGYADITFNGTGTFAAVPAADTQPTITKSAAQPAALRGVTLSILGDSDYVPCSLEFDEGGKEESTLLPSATGGRGETLKVDRKYNWKMKCYRDTNVTPMTQISTGSTGSISMSWGNTPNKITITINNCQIKKVGTADQNSIETYEIDGSVNYNDVTIELDTTAA
jgi:hypothetical protein